MKDTTGVETAGDLIAREVAGAAAAGRAIMRQLEGLVATAQSYLALAELVAEDPELRAKVSLGRDQLEPDAAPKTAVEVEANAVLALATALYLAACAGLTGDAAVALEPVAEKAKRVLAAMRTAGPGGVV